MVCLHCPTLKLAPCGGVHTAQRQMTTQISFGLCVLVLGICLSIGIGLGKCESTISCFDEKGKQKKILMWFSHSLPIGVNEPLTWDLTEN